MGLQYASIREGLAQAGLAQQAKAFVTSPTASLSFLWCACLRALQVGFAAHNQWETPFAATALFCHAKSRVLSSYI